METQQFFQELKAERVQEELMAEAVSRLQPVRIELLTLQVVLTLHGQAGSDPAHSPGETR